MRISQTILCLLLASLFAGCHREKRQPAEYSYQIRGIVVSTSIDQRGIKQIKIKHEAIPQFFDAEGKGEPMHAMAMAFPVDDGIALDSLQKGDEVEATYEIRWKSSPREIISKLATLTPGTVTFKKPEIAQTP